MKMNGTYTIPGYEAEVHLPFRLPTPVYGAMLGVWQMRPWLQRRFPLQHKDKRLYQKYLAWCTLHGRREYQALKQLPGWDEALSEPARLPQLTMDPWGEMYTVGMSLLVIARYDEYFWPVFCSAGVRRRFWRRYWRKLRVELDLPVPEWQLQAMGKAYGFSVDKLLMDIIPTMERLKIRKNADSLISKYALESVAQYFTGEDSKAGTSLIPQNTQKDLEPIVLSEKEMRTGRLLSFVPLWSYKLLRLATSLRSSRLDPTAENAVMQQIPVKSRTSPQIRHPFGVNLIGYAHGELGQGEDLRMLAQTFVDAKIPFCVINVRPGDNISQQDQTVNDWLSEQPQYGINIFCMTGIEHLRFYLQCGRSTFDGRYTIGLWPWELPQWPDLWSHVYALVDEIWGISEFTSLAYRNAPLAVTTMPLPVSVSPIAGRKRQDFGLPARDYLFIYSFDLSSTLTRKNPMALIEAFQLAFPHDGADSAAGLVLKINNADKLNLHWRSMKRKIANDPRIKVIEETLRRPEVLALYKCCNCFVSLHRSEGFGRGIVESLMLGLDVITTGYSGNMDYADADRVFLVDYELREVKEGEYFLPDGQHWAEPAVSQAAETMRQLKEKNHHVRERCEPFDRYLPTNVSSKYEQNLHLIFEKYQA